MDYASVVRLMQDETVDQQKLLESVQQFIAMDIVRDIEDGGEGDALSFAKYFAEDNDYIKKIVDADILNKPKIIKKIAVGFKKDEAEKVRFYGETSDAVRKKIDASIDQSIKAAKVAAKNSTVKKPVVKKCSVNNKLGSTDEEMKDGSNTISFAPSAPPAEPRTDAQKMLDAVMAADYVTLKQLLARIPSLFQEKTSGIDGAGRVFESVSPLQYAVWAGDYQAYDLVFDVANDKFHYETIDADICKAQYFEVMEGKLKYTTRSGAVKTNVFCLLDFAKKFEEFVLSFPDEKERKFTREQTQLLYSMHDIQQEFPAHYIRLFCSEYFFPSYPRTSPEYECFRVHFDIKNNTQAIEYSVNSKVGVYLKSKEKIAEEYVDQHLWLQQGADKKLLVITHGGGGAYFEKIDNVYVARDVIMHININIYKILAITRDDQRFNLGNFFKLHDKNNSFNERSELLMHHAMNADSFWVNEYLKVRTNISDLDISDMILIKRADVTDPAGRMFKAVSPLEYAIWAGDARTVKVMSDYVDDSDRVRVYKELQNSGLEYIKNGVDERSTAYNLSTIINELRWCYRFEGGLTSWTSKWRTGPRDRWLRIAELDKYLPMSVVKEILMNFCISKGRSTPNKFKHFWYDTRPKDAFYLFNVVDYEILTYDEFRGWLQINSKKPEQIKELQELILGFKGSNAEYLSGIPKLVTAAVEVEAVVPSAPPAEAMVTSSAIEADVATLAAPLCSDDRVEVITATPLTN